MSFQGLLVRTWATRVSYVPHISYRSDLMWKINMMRRHLFIVGGDSYKLRHVMGINAGVGVSLTNKPLRLVPQWNLTQSCISRKSTINKKTTSGAGGCAINIPGSSFCLRTPSFSFSLWTIFFYFMFFLDSKTCVSAFTVFFRPHCRDYWCWSLCVALMFDMDGYMAIFRSGSHHQSAGTTLIVDVLLLF